MTLLRLGVLRPRPHIHTWLNWTRQHTPARTSLRSFATGTPSSVDAYPLLNTRPVPEAPPALASSPQAFLEYLRSPTAAAPFLLRAHRHTHPSTSAHHGGEGRAETLMRTLRASGDRYVEVEAGRYDKTADGTAGVNGRVDVPLSVYLNWLTGAQGGGTGEDARGLQLYLAQWRARDEVPALAEVVQTPSLLAPLLEGRAVDLYQSSFFIGPAAAITPLHYDPYFNLYNVYASSDPDAHAKHFVLLPPILSEHVSRADGSVLRNTSPVDFHLRRGRPDNPLGVAIDPRTASGRTLEVLAESDAALSCVLREGDTLFVPRKWWHRVENVRLQDTATPGWTAGVGWWFLPRNS